MKQVASQSDILNNSNDWQAYYKECENVKADLANCTKDLRFIQQLLDRYFDKIIENENLDEMRESLMLFQDVCYNCDRLKKRVKDQQKTLLEIIKGSALLDSNIILKAQNEIKNLKASLLKDFKMVKKEMYLIADHISSKRKDNENLSYHV